MTDLAQLHASVRQDPLNAELRYLLGAELAERKDYEQAAIELTTAVKLNPSLHTARFQLGLLHLTLNRVDECLAAWAPLDTAEGESSLKLFKHGLEALIRGDFQQCIDLLQRGIEFNTANAPLNRDMAMVTGKAQEALKARSSACAEEPSESAAVRTDFSLYGQTRQ
jgi:tetratricopeptide (TPR) repeat protein